LPIARWRPRRRPATPPGGADVDAGASRATAGASAEAGSRPASTSRGYPRGPGRRNRRAERRQPVGIRTSCRIPRYVVFQLDLYWATRRLGSQAEVVELLERYGDRIQLFHVKDMAAGAFPGRIEIVGDGIIDFAEIFATTKGPVRYYVVEHDPRFGDPTFDPFEAAEAGFDYLDCVTF